MQEQQLAQQLRGNAPLPWEAPALARQLRNRYSGLWASVEALLAREPGQRPPVAAVLQQWHEEFTALDAVASRRA